jgi:predicted ester cyclase
MSIEENKDLIRRKETVDASQIRKNAAAKKDEFCAPEFILHMSTGDLKLKEYHQWAVDMAAAFPDLKIIPDDIIAEGDKVVARCKFTGTHKGLYMGIAPTGKKVNFESIAIYRIAGGLVVETWGIMDLLGMMQQLGVIPRP